ncbi:MAG: hypothetical protein ACO1NO_06720 [Burkholderiaceae bacterium]
MAAWTWIVVKVIKEKSKLLFVLEISHGRATKRLGGNTGSRSAQNHGTRNYPGM